MQKKRGSITNLGDTSLREGNYITPLRIILKLMKAYVKTPKSWKNKKLQNTIYNLFVINMAQQLHGQISRKDAYKMATKKGMRGRGLGNTTTKIGLTDENKQISQVANDWITHNKSITRKDLLEQRLPIKLDNLLFLRQLFKLRIYNKSDNYYIRPLILLFKIFNKYPNASLNQVAYIVDDVQPAKLKNNPNYITNIINGYNFVKDKTRIKNNKLFISYLSKYFGTNVFTNNKQTQVNQLLSLLPVQSLSNLSKDYRDKFNKIFTNNKTHTTLYFKFVNLLMKYRKAYKNKNNHIGSLNSITTSLRRYGSEKKIKKAFNYGNVAFKRLPKRISKKFTNSLKAFISTYGSSPLLKGPSINIYYRFISSKSYDLNHEYADMAARIFSLASVVNKRSNKVEKVLLPFWKCLLNISNYKVAGYGSRLKFDSNSKSPLYKDISLQNILGLSNANVTKVINIINKKYNLSSNATAKDLLNKFRTIEEKHLVHSIKTDFPISTVISLLKLIKERQNPTITTNQREDKDKAIHKGFNKSKKQNKSRKQLFPTQTTVPTIFEFLSGIIWFYLSNENFNLLSSYNLELDGNYLPVRQAPGGVGDIVINEGPTNKLMLEVTLMDPHAQKRGELEPVIRHTVNLKSQVENSLRGHHKAIKIQTIFIADKLDQNVINIFRDMTHVELNNSNTISNLPSVDGVNIFPLSISELILLLKKHKNNPNKYNSNEILRIISNYLNKHANDIPIRNNWRRPIIDKILNDK